MGYWNNLPGWRLKKCVRLKGQKICPAEWSKEAWATSWLKKDWPTGPRRGRKRIAHWKSKKERLTGLSNSFLNFQPGNFFTFLVVNLFNLLAGRIDPKGHILKLTPKGHNWPVKRILKGQFWFFYGVRLSHFTSSGQFFFDLGSNRSVNSFLTNWLVSSSLIIQLGQFFWPFRRTHFFTLQPGKLFQYATPSIIPRFPVLVKRTCVQNRTHLLTYLKSESGATGARRYRRMF